MSRHHLTHSSDRLSDSRLETASSPSEDGPVAEVSAGGQWRVPGSFAKVLGGVSMGENTSSRRGKIGNLEESVHLFSDDYAAFHCQSEDEQEPLLTTSVCWFKNGPELQPRRVDKK